MSKQQAHASHPASPDLPDLPGLRRLLTTWNEHQDLRVKGATPAELWNSRTALDEVRLEVRLAA